MEIRAHENYRGSTAMLKQMFKRQVIRCSRALWSDRDTRPRVLGYHSVGRAGHELEMDVDCFQTQIDWLCDQGYQMCTLSQWFAAVQAGCETSRMVMLTFDDGYQGVVKHAAPILVEHNIPGTVFVVTDYVGASNVYDRPLGAPELPIMSWQQLEELQALGWDIQSHGRGHRLLVDMASPLLDEEVRGSKDILEQRLGKVVNFYCYPYGAFDADAVRSVQRAGYVGAVTGWPGALSEDGAQDWYHLPRVMADEMPGDVRDMTLDEEFDYAFTSAYRHTTYVRRQLDRLVNRGRECRRDDLSDQFVWIASRND